MSPAKLLVHSIYQSIFHHNIDFSQLIYKHGLAEHPVMEDTIDFLFSTMKEFRLGKSSTIFHNAAKDLGHIVLTNKKDTTTRFIRSAARGVKTFLQNLPTIAMILNSIYENHALEGENTEAREILVKVQKLRDPRFILLVVGLAQIMEAYCEVSLEGQYSSHFPTQVWDSVESNRSEMQLLAENWTWGWKDLKYTDIEAPEKIKDRLMTEGVYRPKIMYKNVMRKGAELREAGLLEEDQKVADLFNNDEMIKALAGEIPVEVPLPGRPERRIVGGRGADFLEDPAIEDDGRAGVGRRITDADVTEVEEELQGLCESIVTQWNERMIQSPLAKATCEALGKPMKLEEDLNILVAKMRQHLSNVLDVMPTDLSERYNISMLLDGYGSFMEEFRDKNEDFKQHEIYYSWHKKYVSIENPKESNVHFADFFECL